MVVRCHRTQRRGWRIGGQTFTVETAFFFLRICGFAARVIKCEEVERKVAKIVLYSSFGVSDRAQGCQVSRL